ncbi:hypothetical protein Intca_2765 [Intrasporangium calvum DSM 43043]|uniref:Uncharacterized protein n=1 Tax=Intrasporangium calvum (strain ATCC 23552 / DSM 43043 / JCM 3097 / NBRC 12989 / NCIMB 10167 / NRRL B-3866 / 7 KIP) TaxID=710696 RepID=E6S9M8_INTC7|nr:hypothetical protein Intca_2765 [Intrasporangium calvum DSM 43043]
MPLSQLSGIRHPRHGAELTSDSPAGQNTTTRHI